MYTIHLSLVSSCHAAVETLKAFVLVFVLHGISWPEAPLARIISQLLDDGFDIPKRRMGWSLGTGVRNDTRGVFLSCNIKHQHNLLGVLTCTADILDVFVLNTQSEVSSNIKRHNCNEVRRVTQPAYESYCQFSR